MASEIIVSINVQSGKAEVSLGKAKKGVDKLAAAKEKLADSETQLAKDIALVNLKTKEQIQVNNQAAAATLKNVNKGSGQFRTQVGLNNAILTEAGRAASDLRFGFNGVANNVGQLASLFGSLINTSDNVLTSLKNLGKSLLGTGGVLIAIQLLIAYGDRIYDFFVGSAEAIDVETDALIKNNAELDKSIAKREILGKVIGETLDSFSSDFVINLMNGLNLLEDTDLTLAEISERFSAIGVRNAKILKDETIANDARLEIAFRLIDIFKEETELKNLRRLQDEELLKGQKEGVEVNELKIKQFSVDIIQTRRRIKELNKDVETLTKRGVVVTPDKEPSGGTNTADSLTKFLDLSKKIQAARADVRKGAAIDDMDAIRIQGENEEELLEIIAKVFLDKQKQRLEQKLITQKQYNDSELQAQEELAEAIEATQEKTVNRQLNLQGKRNEKANQLNIDASFIREELMLNEELMEDRILGRRATSLLNFQQERLNTEIEGLKARLEAEELHVEQRAKLQKQLSQAELKESGIRTRIADAEANAKIESLTLVSSALSVASKIAGESSKAGKALAVSSALITTYLSANKAYLSQFNPIPTASSPVRGAVAAAVAVASGLANVKAILATNPAGQLSAGSSGANVTAPSFNVVGSSATNQLAQTVAGQINEPLRAYVVGSDISDQQELDRSIISTAGIG
jgi:6-pyruvoyl-tetrahydropterin synthase